MTNEVREARRLARAEFGITLVWPLLIGFLWVAQPGFMGGPYHEPGLLESLPWVAWSVYFVGLAWMIRIYRTSHLEPEPPPWRYRDT